jgi:hypothetical protein
MSGEGEPTPLPSRHAVRLLVEDLVGRNVDLSDAQPLPAKNTNVYAVYVNNRVAVSAVVMTNLELAARLGGALGMLPKGGVDDAIKERDLYPMLRDCCYEVLNVMASLFNVPNAQHVRLYEMYGPGGSPAPADVQQLGTMLGNRLDVRLTIAGYGDGLMAVVVR